MCLESVNPDQIALVLLNNFMAYAMKLLFWLTVSVGVGFFSLEATKFLCILHAEECDIGKQVIVTCRSNSDIHVLIT